MTSNPPGQGFQNKNRVAILAELDKEKRRLIQNQTMNSPGASIPLSRPAVNKDFRDHAEQQHIAAQQKAALQAEDQSCYKTVDFHYPRAWGLLQHSPDSVKSRHRDLSPQHAHAHSSGFFITQDSSFGNLILPVLPRQEPE